jgi:hypothetical protein
MGFRFIWQNGQKKGCRDILQHPANVDEFDENGRRKVYSFMQENKKSNGGRRIYIYLVALWFRLGITKLRGNREVTLSY